MQGSPTCLSPSLPNGTVVASGNFHQVSPQGAFRLHSFSIYSCCRLGEGVLCRFVWPPPQSGPRMAPPPQGPWVPHSHPFPAPLTCFTSTPTTTVQLSPGRHGGGEPGSVPCRNEGWRLRKGDLVTSSESTEKGPESSSPNCQHHAICALEKTDPKPQVAPAKPLLAALLLGAVSKNQAINPAVTRLRQRPRQ